MYKRQIHTSYKGFEPEQCVVVKAREGVNEVAELVLSEEITNPVIGGYACSILTSMFVFGQGKDDVVVQKIVSELMKKLGLAEVSLGELFYDLITGESAVAKGDLDFVNYLRRASKEVLDMPALQAAAQACLQAKVDKGEVHARLENYTKAWSILTYGATNLTIQLHETKGSGAFLPCLNPKIQ